MWLSTREPEKVTARYKRYDIQFYAVKFIFWGSVVFSGGGNQLTM